MAAGPSPTPRGGRVRGPRRPERFHARNFPPGGRRLLDRQLTPPEKSEEEAGGARFVSRFDKIRNATGEDCPPIEFTFRRGENGKAEVIWKHVGQLEKFRYLIEKGLTTATQIAEEMGISAPRVSYLAKTAMKEGWLRKNGRNYELVKSASASCAASSGSSGLSQADADEVLADFPEAKAE